jgi:hypothetical protein
MGLEWLWSPGLETGPSLLLTIVHDDLRLVLNIKEKGLPSRERSGSPSCRRAQGTRGGGR